MIDGQRQIFLSVLFDATMAKGPGALSFLRLNCGIDDADEHFLNWLTDYHDSLENRLKRFPRNDFDNSVDIGELSEQLFEIEAHNQEMRNADVPYLSRALFLLAENYEEKIKQRDRARCRLFYRENPTSSRLTESEITLAREYPLENLVKLNRSHMMLCPFHEEQNPSFWVRHGFGHCFSCRKTCDAIGYLMHTTGRSFVDVVRELAGRS